MRKWICCLILLLSAGAAHAATKYVSDQIPITLRAGPSVQYHVLKSLAGGTPLQVVQPDTNGWTQVQTQDGQTGWVLTRYLMDTPSARAQLASVTKQLDDLRAANKNLVALQSKVQQLTKANEQMKQKLAEAGQGLKMADENQRLKKQAIDLQRSVQDLRHEVERLSERGQQEWFLFGAGVMFLGVIVGVILRSIRWRRKSTWGSL